MKTYLGTTTLNGLIDDLEFCDNQSEAEILLIGGKVIDLDAFPKLLGIFKTGVGTDNLPFDGAAQRGIKIGMPQDRAREVIYDETAAFACNLIFQSIYRNIGEFDTWKKAGRNSLASHQLLVIGTGNIGSKVCEKMNSCCHVTHFDAQINDPSELEPLVREADVISLHIPLTEQTTNFWDKQKLSWMTDGASIVNTARGSVINEGALYEELESGRIFAALDVFWQEPYSGPLTELNSNQVILSPHVASTCQQFLIETARDFREFIGEIRDTKADNPDN